MESATQPNQADVEQQPTTETAALAQVSAARRSAADAGSASASDAGTAPTVPAPLATTATGDQCAVCGSVLGADQRYCLVCGERRGAARLPIMDGVNGAHRQAAPAPRKKQGSRWSPNATMIAGVGTLLLALGVGVLIGRESNNSSSSGNSGVQVLKVPAAAGAATAGTGGTASTANKAAAANTSGAAKKPAKHVQSVAAAVGGTSSVEGKPKEKLPPPTVGIGDKGKGAGYTNGKFTGDFFK
jgi:hypothetical protein